jgi:hypothetical protein
MHHKLFFQEHNKLPTKTQETKMDTRTAAKTLLTFYPDISGKM